MAQSELTRHGHRRQGELPRLVVVLVHLSPVLLGSGDGDVFRSGQSAAWAAPVEVAVRTMGPGGVTGFLMSCYKHWRDAPQGACRGDISLLLTPDSDRAESSA